MKIVTTEDGGSILSFLDLFSFQKAKQKQTNKQRNVSLAPCDSLRTIKNLRP